MSLLPRLASLSGKVLLLLGSVGARPYAEFGKFETLRASAILPRLSGSLVHLTIILGADIGEIDDAVLVSVLEHVATHCPDLESVSMYKAWTEGDAALVQNRVPSLKGSSRSISGPAPITYWVVARDGSRSLSSAALPLDCVATDAMGYIANLVQDLTLHAPLSQTAYSANSGAILAALTRARPGHLRRLREAHLPLEYIADLGPFLFTLSTLPEFRRLALSPPSHPLSREEKLPHLNALLRGLHGFDHLKELWLPASIVCDSLLRCLGNILDLQVLKIIGTLPGSLSIQSRHPLPGLNSLEISGALADAANVVRAIAPTGLKRISVDARSLQHKSEMRGAVFDIVECCPGLRGLEIRIRGVHPREKPGWIDISYLDRLSQLEEVAIHHPRPLPLTDRDIRLLLLGWPGVTSASFNPRPTLPPWTAHGGMAYRVPTLACLPNIVMVADSLRHLSIFLNLRAACGDVASGRSMVALRELDLGSSGDRRRHAALINRLFPNAHVL